MNPPPSHPQGDEDLRRQIYKASLIPINNVYYVPPGVDGSWGLPDENIDKIISLFEAELHKREAAAAELVIDKAVELVLIHSFTVKDTSYGRVPKRQLVSNTAELNKDLLGLKAHLQDNHTTKEAE